MAFGMKGMMKMKPRSKLKEMLKYKRPAGSWSLESFNTRFIQPLMGKPDKFGNYVYIVGDRPNVCFMAHHDSVHYTEGMQNVIEVKGIVKSDSGECLGADCATGVWLILELILAKVSGVYVIHAEEESGCIGSSNLVNSQPNWLEYVDFAISLDRYGTKSIITHQMGQRCCSEQFSESLSTILDMGHVSDNRGSYTDSNEYIYDVSECTNLSVGYYNQHKADESQDLNYAMRLRHAMINADWSRLVAHRDVSMSWDYEDYSTPTDNPPMGLRDLCELYPDEVAEVLASMGLTTTMVKEEIQAVYGDFV